MGFARGGLIFLVFIFGALGVARPAEALRFQWKNVDGLWNDKDNWIALDGGSGYPNHHTDVAFFSGPYTGPRTVSIGINKTVTVGTIFFTDAAITIRNDPGGKLAMNAGVQIPQIIRIGVPPLSEDVISAPIELQSTTTNIVIGDVNARFTISGVISSPGCGCGILKRSGGRLYLQGNNSYSGATFAEGGMLILDGPANETIRGPLEIGSATEGDQYGEVLIAKPDQISDSSRVTITSHGLLTVDAPERLGSEVYVNDGFITIRGNAGVLTTGALSMTGGTIDSRTNGRLRLDNNLTAISSSKGPAAIVRSSGLGVLDLGDVSDAFNILDGPSPTHDLTIDLPIAASDTNTGLSKLGTGTLRFTASNTYTGATRVLHGTLWLEPPNGVPSIAGPLSVGGGPLPALAEVRRPNAIFDDQSVEVGLNGSLWFNATTPERVNLLSVSRNGFVAVGNLTTGARLIASSLSMEGGSIEISGENTLETASLKALSDNDRRTASIRGGNMVLGGARTLEVRDGPAPIDLLMDTKINGGANDLLKKESTGVLDLRGVNNAPTTIAAGTVLVNGGLQNSPIALTSGTIGGVGRTGTITVLAGSGAANIAPGEEPGVSIGRLQSRSIALAPGTAFEVELDGDDLQRYDQLAVIGAVNLGGAALGLKPTDTLPPDARWTIIDNDGSDPVIGTFAELPEGGRIRLRGNEYRITYRGGDGNDVVIETAAPPTYYLAEGATGEFFDDDVLIANPNEVDAPVTITFLREGGATVVIQRVIPARKRVTIHVDQIEGLESASASVKVESTNYLQLVVERSMFWDRSYYGGHTANAVSQPEGQWIFAEGFQGFFDTYLLIANANATKTAVTLTFLRENDTPVVKTVEVDPFARKTVYAGEFDELKGRAFGIVVDATQPVIAERSMYFATQPDRLWGGGHGNAGIVAPSRTWFHAEGATGTYFSTFILLSNPQDTDATVEVRFLLPTGEVISRTKTLAAKQRLTINPASEGDARLENTAVSTVVQSDVPIVSERSMYWEGDRVAGSPFGEGHNSSGVAATGLRWGLSEGRIGGDRAYDTYILLANPSTEAAKVRVTYLRESGAPIVREYDVPATSRFNIDVKTVVQELRDSSFGADIEVLNDVPIAVERSIYWNAIGAFWAGGTNALATPLRPAP